MSAERRSPVAHDSVVSQPTWRPFWILLGGLALYVVALNVGTALIAHATAYSGGSGDLFSLSMTPGYSPTQAHQTLSQLGSTGRAADGITLAVFDIGFPLLYGTLLAVGLNRIAARLGFSQGGRRLVTGLPLIAAVANWLADVSIIVLIVRYPSSSDAAAIAASLFTTIKLFIIVASILAIVVGAVVVALRRSAGGAASAEAAPATAVMTRAQRGLLACGIAGPVLFNIVYLIEGATRPGYDAWRQPVSALSLGDSGWTQIANFIVFGLLVSAFAFGLRSVLAPGPARLWAPLLQVVVGLGLLVAGIFVQDPAQGYPVGVSPPANASLHGIIHLAATFIVFNARIVWCFVMAGRFAHYPRWRGWAVSAVATGVAMMILLGAFGASMGGTGPAGLFERLATGVTSLFTLCLAIRLLTLKNPSAGPIVTSLGPHDRPEPDWPAP